MTLSTDRPATAGYDAAVGPTERRASINDVARAAGVSTSTVSRVLASPGFGRPETRDRVRAAAQELGWAGSRTPPTPPAPRAGTIGVVISQLDNPFFAQLATALLDSAHRQGYGILLGDATATGTALADFTTQCDALVVWAPSITDTSLGEYVRQVPCVVLNGAHRRSPRIVADGADAVGEVIDYLVTLGHRRLGYATTTQQSASLRSRLDAARAQAAAREVDLTVLAASGSAVQSVRHIADLATARDVTAVLAQNDLAAMGLVREFSRRGLAVPGDISVVGCDDNPAAQLCLPSLTTIAMPIREVADAAVGQVHDLVTTGATPTEELHLPARLVVRESTGPAPERVHGASRSALPKERQGLE